MAQQEQPALSRIQKLQAEIDSLQNQAKEDLLKRIRADINELNAMGLNYKLVAGARRNGSSQRHSDPTRPCPVCRFVTTPHHDARTHRGQGKSKKPFTAAELKELGLSKA